MFVCTCMLRDLTHLTKQRYRDSYLCHFLNAQYVVSCLNVWLLLWNMSEKLIMWHHSGTHYELWMNFTLVDEIMLCEFNENNIVYWVGRSMCCLPLVLWASQIFHYLHNLLIIVLCIYCFYIYWSSLKHLNSGSEYYSGRKRFVWIETGLLTWHRGPWSDDLRSQTEWY